jgi:hypothetical protein
MHADASDHFLLEWVDLHRTSEQPVDPTWPNGTPIDAALDAPVVCQVALPYPAPRCGFWKVTCRVCGFFICLGTTGRPDDPVSVKVPCPGPEQSGRRREG